MLASGLVDTDDLVGQIRWQRRFHIIMFLASMAGLVLFATCGMDTPNPNAPDPIEGSVMWYRYMFVITTVLSVIATEVYLLFSYRSFYLFHLVANMYAVAMLGWNAVSMIIILATCDSQYPQCSLAKFTYVIRFCTAMALLIIRIFAVWNASGLQNTVNNIRRIRTTLIKQSQIVAADGGQKNELAEIYQQIRNEQILHVITMILTSVAWGFFAVSEMWITFRNGSDDAWVTWIWWRNFLSLATLAPLAITQIYFLLGGTISRAASRWSNFIWVLGILPVHAVYLLYIYDNCNKYDMAVTLVHPECGTPNILDDSVQPAFVWRICSFFALFACAMLNLLVFNTVTHSLLSLAIVKKRDKGLSGDVEDPELLQSQIGGEIGLSKQEEKHAELKYMHHKVYGGPTISQMIHRKNTNGLIKEAMRDHPDMFLFDRLEKSE